VCCWRVNVLLAYALSLCLALLERVLVLELGSHFAGVGGVLRVFMWFVGGCGVRLVVGASGWKFNKV
jgi:hypothetical protein